jgi:hypothetical protein
MHAWAVYNIHSSASCVYVCLINSKDTGTRAQTHTHTHANTHTHTPTHTHTHTYTHIHTHIYTHTYAHASTLMRTCMHAYPDVRTCTCVLLYNSVDT